jgi:MoaA/NifB/PqqE/SkfB family radical SAM enzyme
MIQPTQQPCEAEGISEREKTFLNFLRRGEPPCDYEFQLLKEHFPRVKAALEGKVVVPYELEIQPTATCNLACKHCFGRFYEPLQDRMGVEEMREIAKKVDDFKENGFRVEVAKFCGTTGEPLVNPAVVEGIRLFKELDRKVIVFTNGLLLDARVGNNGDRYYDVLLYADKINLSLDTASEETFMRLKGRRGFRRVISGLEALSARKNGKPNIVVSFVIGQENFHEIASAAEIAKRAGADEIRYRVDFTNVGVVKDLSERIIGGIHEAMKYRDKKFRVVSVYSEDEISEDDSAFRAAGRRCFNHHFWASIGPDCHLYACGHRTHCNVESYGDLFTYPFRDLWLGENRQKSVRSLPDKNCETCSPSSLRRNDFMTFLSTLPVEEVERLYKKCVK